MPTLSEYFEAEARDMIALLDRGLQEAAVPDAAELHRAARAVRGAAQMAREDRVYRAAGALEMALRGLMASQIQWSAALADDIRATLDDLQALLAGGADDELESRAAQVVRRWSDAGVQLPPHIAGGEARETGATGPRHEFREFRDFAAREVAGVADVLESAVQQLATDPMNREPLRLVLRRQRALLGSARLDDLPVVAEILRAIEDLTRVIAKLDIGVKREWLDIYRVARDALRSAIGPLERNEDPQPTHALSRLRHMREELIERYGTGEAVSAAHDTAGLVQATQATQSAGDSQDETPGWAAPAPAAGAAHDDESEDLVLLEEDQVVATGGAVAQPLPPVAPAVAGAAGGVVVPVDQLLYDRDGALRRILELRDVISAATADDPAARAAADELFDLVRLALG